MATSKSKSSSSKTSTSSKTTSSSKTTTTPKQTIGTKDGQSFFVGGTSSGSSSSAPAAVSKPTTTAKTSSIAKSTAAPKSGGAAPAATSGGMFMDGSGFDAAGNVIKAKSPVVTSEPARDAYSSLQTKIDSMAQAAPKFSTTYNGKKYDSAESLFDAQRQSLDSRRKAEISRISGDYGAAKTDLAQTQRKEVGTQSMGLARMGGFDSASGQAVLTNLSRTHINEQEVLLSKKETAILQAQQAFEDKDFALAKLQLDDAKETEKLIYDRQKDHIALTLSLKGEERANAAFELTKQQRLDGLRKEAEEFNYKNGVQSPFITIDGTTVLRSETHEPVTEAQFFQETGFKSWDEVPAGTIQTVQRPEGGLNKDQMIQGKDGWYDISGPVPRLVIPESPTLQVIGQRTNAYGETTSVYGSYNMNTGRWEEASGGAAVGQGVAGALNSIPKFADGEWGGQCGDFAHQLADFPSVGNTLASKKATIDKAVQGGTAVHAKQWREQGARPGDVLISSDHATAGHVMTVITNNGDGTVTVKDSNYSDKNDEKIRTRIVKMDDSKIYGAFRSNLKVAAGPEKNGLARNPKMDKVVDPIIKGTADWATAARMIDNQFGEGTASLYDKELKIRYYLPSEAAKMQVSDQADWATKRAAFQRWSSSELGIDEATAGESWDKAVPKPTEATSSGNSVLSKDYFRGIWKENDLKEAAKKAGYMNDVKWGFDTPNVEGYLDYIMTRIDGMRKAGYNDKQILEEMQKSK